MQNQAGSLGTTEDPAKPYDSPALDQSGLAGYVDHVSWLADNILLIVCWFHAEEADAFQAALALERQVVPIDAEYRSYPRPDVILDDSRAGKVIVARLSRSDNQRWFEARLIIQTGGRTFALDPSYLSEAESDLPTLLQSSMAGLGAELRTELTEFVASVAGKYRDATNSSSLCQTLPLIRDALRARVTNGVISPQRPMGIWVDALLAIDDRSFYVKGWIRDDVENLSRLTLVSPEGNHVELLGKIFRYARRDIIELYGISNGDPHYKHGFIGYFETPVPSLVGTGWLVEISTESLLASEVPAPPVVKDPTLALQAIIADLEYERVACDDLTLNHVFPAVSRLQKRLERSAEVDHEDVFGKSCGSPDVSIVIPLYEQIDFLEHQLAQFVTDPEIQQAELIYVLDSPELADKVRECATQLFGFYRVPFRVLTLKRNVGFPRVNNIAASRARGRLLLLLNSDVLPDRAGWLGKMATFYDATPRIGALGAKLLFEDDSLQHAGMYFSELAGLPLWENRHYFKGLHRRLPAANVSRPVPAVTGACLMIDRHLYEEIGGLRNIYVKGGYEDSDLCLRLIERGYENWYTCESELYHLEGQSFPFTTRTLTTKYNRWLHTRLWRERMEEVMKKFTHQP